MKWIGWCGIVLLVASLMWTTGCGGRDGDDGTTTVVVTNANGETTTVIVTNTPVNPSSTTTTLTEAGYVAELVSPELIAPVNGRTIYSTLNPDVAFEWTAVPGATEYVLKVNDTSYVVPTTKHTVNLPLNGIYYWRVQAWSKYPPPSPFSYPFGFKTVFKPIVPLI